MNNVKNNRQEQFILNLFFVLHMHITVNVIRLLAYFCKVFKQKIDTTDKKKMLSYVSGLRMH